MSEQILERNASASTAPIPGDLGESGTPEAATGGRNRTFVIVALAVVGGLILGGLFLFVLRPSPSEDVAQTPFTGGSPAGVPAAGATASDGGAAAAEATADSAAEAAPAKKASTRLTSRDPFAPLIPKKPVPVPKPTKAATAVTATSPAGSMIPAPSTPASGGTISALSISPLGNAVTLKLDGKKYEVDEGETFAKSYRLYDIFNANCAGFLYGDRNAVVCEGDSVTVG